MGEARRGDLFILGDVDEIPRPAALSALRRCHFEAAHNCAAMESDMFYYSYSLYSGVWKAGPKVASPHKAWLGYAQSSMTWQ